MNTITPLNEEILDLHGRFLKKIDSLVTNLYERAEGKKIDTHDYVKDLLPVFYRDFKNEPGKILITGINPSFSYNFYPKIDKRIFSYSKFLKISFIKKVETITHLISIQESLIYGNKYSDIGLRQLEYFKVIEEFVNEIGYKDKVDHYDIFSNRCTSQDLFIRAVKQLEEFQADSFHRFRKIVNNYPYKLVLILNAQASRFIKKNLNLKPVRIGIFNSNYNHGFYKWDQAPEVTFLLFKILSGRNRPSRDEKKILLKEVKKYLTSL